MEEDDRDYFDNDEIVEAVNRFRTMVKNDSFEYFDVYEVEGIVDYFLEVGKINLAEKAVTSGLEIHPNSIALQIKKAQVLLINGYAEESLEIIQIAEKIESANSDVYLVKGSALIMQGDVDEAIVAFEMAISQEQEDSDDLLYNIGVTLGQAGEINYAIHFLERAYETDPQNELVLYELGYYYDKVQEFEKSIYFYNKYLDIDPFNSSCLVQYGNNL